MKKNKRKRKVEYEKQRMQIDIFESKLKALRSQMNPHFIFNSLNSIQALVLKKDIEKSYDYIEMFSNLVRKTLVFSEKNYIPISEETDFLNIYLDLESLRMKEEFSFKIENNTTQDIQIPSLLIQPFLENAIHHGLLHKNGQKELSIFFNCEKEFASCIIIDNGIGRDKANEINQRQKYRHDSFSLASLNKRLEILSEQNNTKFDYTIEDLFTNGGIASGTKVTVNFPYKNQY
jgi:sensor histidine kinase YesM